MKLYPYECPICFGRLNSQTGKCILREEEGYCSPPDNVIIIINFLKKAIDVIDKTHITYEELINTQDIEALKQNIGSQVARISIVKSMLQEVCSITLEDGSKEPT